MPNVNPGLFGLKYSNRDFTSRDTWGKNQFNSSFPAALCSYLYERDLENVYIKLNDKLKITHSFINSKEFYGIDPTSENIFYAFESPYTPYQQLLIGSLPRIDLVTQKRDTGECLRGIEIKLTALPDNSTCDLSDEEYGCEIVVRPDTIVYLACSIVLNYKDKVPILKNIIGSKFNKIKDWTDAGEVFDYIPVMIDIIDKISLDLLGKQSPLLMQPIWKTEGKSPKLANNCLDVFVWSDLAFARLFLDLTRSESSTTITRQARTVSWLFKMIYDFSIRQQIDHTRVIDELSYNTKNDKAFAVNGKVTHPYMKSGTLKKPRIEKKDIKNIIIGGGQALLSPERRFDAIIYNSPELFGS